ncbi:MAG TPA: hypothetical protein VFI39_05210 [Gemmatimonadales bacterium]|nr:hypothetical protein [Gemmatimonadales bacterium]
MTKTFTVLAALWIAAAAACAPHGPFSAPLAVADTAGLPEAYMLRPGPTLVVMATPTIIPWTVQDTIVVRYVVDTSGFTDPRTYRVVRGHDSRHISVLEDQLRHLRYRPARDQDGKPLRSWMTATMVPNHSPSEGGPDIKIDYQ